MFGITRQMMDDSIMQVANLVGKILYLSLMTLLISVGHTQVFVPKSPPTTYSPPIDIDTLRPVIIDTKAIRRTFVNPYFDDDDEPPDQYEPLVVLESFLQGKEQVSSETGEFMTINITDPSKEHVYGWVYNPPKITLGARVVGKEDAPIVFDKRDKVSIEAYVYLNERIIRRLNLLNNGESGAYSTVFIPPSPGTYRFQVKAKLTIYRGRRVFRKNLNTKETTFHVVAVPYVRIERPSHGSVLREDLQVTAKIFRLKKLYEETGTPLNATLIVRREEYEEQIPMQRIGSILTASVNMNRNSTYDIIIKMNYNTRWRLFTVFTEPIRVRVEKPIPISIIALYTLSFLTVLIVAFRTYSVKRKTNNT